MTFNPSYPVSTSCIRREYNVIINRPKTVAAFFSSLQMGFRMPIAIRTIQKKLKVVELLNSEKVQQIFPKLTNGELIDEE